MLRHASLSFFKKNPETDARLSVKAVNMIKIAVNSAYELSITDFHKDNRDWLKKTLPFVLKSMGLTDNSMTANESLREAVMTLKMINETDRGGLYRRIGAGLLMSRQKMNTEMAILLVHEEYLKTK